MSMWKDGLMGSGVAAGFPFVVAGTPQISRSAMARTKLQVFRTSSKPGTYHPSRLRFKANPSDIIEL